MKPSTTDLAKLIWKTSLPAELQWEVISEYMIRSVCKSCGLPHNKHHFALKGDRRSGRTTKAIVEAIVSLMGVGGVDIYVNGEHIKRHVVDTTIQMLDEMGIFIQMASRNKIMTQYGSVTVINMYDDRVRGSSSRVYDHSYMENQEFPIF